MVATIQQIIGKVNPLLYAENGKELLRKYGSADNIPAEEIKPKPESEHQLVYDSSAESLEPVYFFIVDLMNDRGLDPQKLIDNFSDAAGGQHFSETGMKMQRMQEESTKIMGMINTVLRSVLNIVHDLKDFRIRLQVYDDLSNKDKNTGEAAKLSLKQIWLDKVDIVKGNSSIKGMALGQAGFQTLLDGFLVAKDEKGVDDIDLNDRVKRILKSRIHEFNTWLEQSEKELRKRYEMERIYLKSQVSNLKLYSRWVKPYLKAVQQLESKDAGRNPELVKMFNTVLLELSLLGKSKINADEAALLGELPRDFQKMKLKRNYYSCILIDFNFRAIPSQGRFIGKSTMNISAYSLNDDEMKKIDRELEKSDVGDVLKLIEGATTESLDQLQDEINFFLEEKDEKKEKQSSDDGSNPFLALIGYYDKAPKKESGKKQEDKDKPVKQDDWIEKTHLRELGKTKAKALSYELFDIYKKAHGMVSFT
ncbi:MAG TPA: hypothetical protein ENG87_01445 [Candidatus Pacearchaeota archaeon]|nr:hypothetical protein BMS3Abin17_00342 [archaeon BMS3Abin17]HDK42015.1 hypothetical protein [Candidatus Pacearchaeota archaeon]HDZ60852.1 hypothetical protein [Candidatus Pacearchaeota archaeon]